MVKDSSLSNSVAASGLAGRIPQAEGSAAATGTVPEGTSLSIEGIVDSPHSATAHGVEKTRNTRRDLESRNHSEYDGNIGRESE